MGRFCRYVLKCPVTWSDCQVLQLPDLIVKPSKQIKWENYSEKWENEGLMSFNPNKCEVIRNTKKRNPTIFEYVLHGKILKLVSCVKYLGITVSQDLSWTKHVNQVTTKSNNTMKFIKRNIQTNNRKPKEIAYRTYIIHVPLTEYAASVWDPWQKKYIYINFKWFSIELWIHF